MENSLVWEKWYWKKNPVEQIFMHKKISVTSRLLAITYLPYKTGCQIGYDMPTLKLIVVIISSYFQNHTKKTEI